MKQDEIPPDKTPPNAAPVAEVADAVRLCDRLNLNWNASCEAAGVTRNTAYKLKHGKASVGSLRKVQRYLAEQEAKLPKAKASDPVEEFRALGEQLFELSASEFDEVLQGLRIFVDAEKRKHEGFRSMFRVTPDRRR